MASSSKMSDTVESLLDCGICFHHYNNRENVPIVFRCQHTVCRSCLTNLLRARHTSGSFPCPICRESVEVRPGGPDAYPKNRLLLELVQSEKPELKDIKCQKHPSKRVTHVCITCKEGLCSNCVVDLAKGEQHSGHHLEDLEDAFCRMDAVAEVYRQFLEDFMPLQQIRKVHEKKVREQAMAAKLQVAKMADDAVCYVQNERRRLETEVDGQCAALLNLTEEQYLDSDEETDMNLQIKEVIDKLTTREISAVKSSEELSELEKDTELMILKDSMAEYDKKLRYATFKVTPGNIRSRTLGSVKLRDGTEGEKKSAKATAEGDD